MLQELINNYEQLQKIYISQENVESVYSDSEIDEVFKAKNKAPKRMKGQKVSTKKPNSEKFAATRMDWSDHDEDNDDSDAEDTKEIQKDVIKKFATKNYTIEPKQNLLPASLKTTTLTTTSEENTDKSSDTSSSQEIVKMHEEKVVKKPTNTANIARPKYPQMQTEVRFVDTHKKQKYIPMQIQKEVKPKLKPKLSIESAIQFVGIPTKPKTRYSKVSYRDAKKSELQLQYQIPKANINDTKKVKKVMHSESFSPKKIWNDIISNKPIQLEAHNEITLRRLDNVKQNQTTFTKRTNRVESKGGKSAIVIITKNKVSET